MLPCNFGNTLRKVITSDVITEGIVVGPLNAQQKDEMLRLRQFLGIQSDETIEFYVT